MDKKDLGFVFELGFNIGIASQIPDNNDISKDLSHKSYNREQLYRRFKNEAQDYSVVKQQIDYLLFKGILTGKNFFKDWIQTKIGEKPFEVIYFQANFYKVFDELKTNTEEQRYSASALEKQLKIKLNQLEIDNLFRLGEMFKADTIILIRSKDKYYLTVVDNSIKIKNVIDYSDIEQVKEMLQKTTNVKRSKSNFANLAVDNTDISNLNIENSLRDYILGIGTKDKPLQKMIQAGSYANSFINLITIKNILPLDKLVSVMIVGYTDEEVCTSNLDYKNLSILQMCQQTYAQMDKQNKQTEYSEKQNDIFKKIVSNFRKTLNISNEVIKPILDLKSGINSFNISTSYSNYQNTATNFSYEEDNDTFRNIHANQITKYLGDKNVQLLFLTGNPGIGKTTALVEYLKQQEGYLFLYISPRTQVNKDLEHKFCIDDEKLYDEKAIYLTTNGNDEKFINNELVNIVNFRGLSQYEDIKQPIQFLPIDRDKSTDEQNLKLQAINENTLVKVNQFNLGVLNRLSLGIDHVITNNLSNKIIATVAMQSLRLTQGGTTANHFKRIFKNVYNDKTNTINIQEFIKLANKCPNIVIMLDEITGDGSGIAFFDELINLIHKKIYFNLPTHLKQKINFKIVVADASITNISVINKHFMTAYNDNDKIYFSKEEQQNTFSVEQFKFRKKYNSICINTNSYPAKSLDISYRLIVNTQKELDKTYIDIIDKEITTEAVNLITSIATKQVIIYIQNIARIETITQLLKEMYFKATNQQLKEDVDYISIYSAMEENKRKNITKNKDTAKFILMTSSASRGISFPNTTFILVDVPTFDIEKNIMEIIQLCYRGRGNYNIDATARKTIKFFVGKTIENYQDISQVKHQLTSTLTLLTLIHTSLLTRIYGSHKVGKQNISLIPVGDKGVEATSEMLIERFSSLVSNLKKEMRKDFSNVSIKSLLDKLIKIFNNTEIQLSGEIYNKTDVSNMLQLFHNNWDKGMDKLLDFDPFKRATVIGDLLIFKIEDQVENKLNLTTNLIYVINELEIKKHLMWAKYNNSFPFNLRQEVTDLLKLLDKFEQKYNEKTMNLSDRANKANMYIAIPILAPFIYNNCKGYQEDDKITFRDILKRYVGTEYRVANALPITTEYKDIPFLYFRSESLPTLQKYNSNYIFCSSEINLINLLLVG
ncbi:MAG: hypothetical protein ATN35_04900 [Epulopiscium sp. Nele67-Bin004]|nr:MAG: hypothetical protein ATN35_04900 [Epulopiscium sp. Nele67-Bin004]